MRRLDFFLISDDTQCDLKSCEILHGIQSDHSPVLLKISSIPESQRGPGYWKFNNSLLNDSNFVDSMQALINKLISHHEKENDIRVFWEFLKHKVRHFAREHSIKKKKERNARINNLERELADMEIKLTESSVVSDSLLSSYQEIQNRLEKECDYITDGIILRSKVRWYEQGEKSTKYFLSLEKRTKAKSHVRKIFLRDSNDHETENVKEILSELKLFYEDLYDRKSAKTE